MSLFFHKKIREAWQERLLKVKEEIESLLQIRKKVGKRILLKQEYVKFKWRTNVIFVLFPVLQLLWRYYNRGGGIFSSHFDPNTSYTVEWVLCQWHHGWLLYLYLSLAIREYVLRLNGSRIYIWWIYHHHISSLMSFVSILLMRSAYTRFKLIFDYATCLFLIIGLIQMWQNYNSKRRHYARTAMGRAGTLDISTGETIVELPSSGCEFQCLKVCLYLLYGLEMSVGIATIFYVFAQGYDLPPQNRFDLFQFEGYLLGILTFSIGLGNTFALYTRPKKQPSSHSQSNLHGHADAYVHSHSNGHNPLSSSLPNSWSENELDAASFKSGKISNRLMKGVKLHRFSQESNLASLQKQAVTQTDDEKQLQQQQQQQQQSHHGDKED
ncbi:hypothetical protein RFI_27529 [Reticulomyxa filosa]|uniref:Uncharacterized protein n=1 Tax=Reticulomyxa filosa TaxID=46433 RepID=X6MA20_RETFI|nr:hypothetical protein RFI_27529 [Reticulomyxa filosa]|eukprot:ETO09850.1 hypothetical protein RFI_27529 [Reticulomyxa filosa]